MDVLRSVRAFVALALLATILMVVGPFFSGPSAADSQHQASMATSLPGSMDCEMCPKADMALTGCPQMICQLAANEMSVVYLVAEAMRYEPAAMVHPAEWHTVPPVSPG
jgi:hypothetical protein